MLKETDTLRLFEITTLVKKCLALVYILCSNYSCMWYRTLYGRSGSTGRTIGTSMLKARVFPNYKNMIRII